MDPPVPGRVRRTAEFTNGGVTRFYQTVGGSFYTVDCSPENEMGENSRLPGSKSKSPA